MIGKTISHYIILDKTGSGGMGVIYRAEDTKLHRIVALKFLPPAFALDDELKQRFIREAQSASALDHPNICTIYEIDETPEGQLFIVMAYYNGETLKQKITNGSLEIDDYIDITLQTANGLEKAHEKGIVHRDIKPANIFITDDGTVKILDFGLAKAKDQTEISRKDSTSGTISYMSPEQIAGDKVDQRTDIWSMGVVMYEMFAGKKPFKGDFDQAVIYSILNEVPEPVSLYNENLPPEIENIINKCLQKEPEDRYQKMDDLLADFKVFSKEIEISYDESLPRLLKRLWRRKFVRRFSIVTIALVLAATSAIIFQPTVNNPIPIAVASFENHTGEEKYDMLSCKLIPNWLITNLEQSGRFQVIPWERMYDILKQLDKENSETINNELGFEICRFEGVPNIVVGSFAKSGDIFITDLKVLDVDTKKIRQTAQATGRGENSILETQMDELIREVSTDFGELKEVTYSESQRPIIDITTNSIEAFKFYVLGREYNHQEMIEEARKNYARAIEIDSTFAMAHLSLAMTYRPSFRRNIMIMEKHAELANKYRHKVTYKERVILDYLYALMKRKNVKESVSELKKAAALYPREKQIYYVLAEQFRLVGEDDSAIAFYEKTLELDPNHKRTLTQMGYTYVQLKNYKKGIEYFQRYAEAAPDEFNPYDCLAETYLNMNENIKSIELYEKVLKMNPSLPWPHYNIAQNYIKMREYEKARERLIPRLELEKDHNNRWGIHYWFVVSYVGEENYEYALKEINIMDSLANHELDTARVILSKFQKLIILPEMHGQEKIENNLSEIKKLMRSFNPHDYRMFNADCYLSLVKSYLDIGNIKQAKDYLQLYKKTVEKIETSFNKKSALDLSLVYSGIISYEEGLYGKAISDINLSEQDDPYSNYYLALAYLKSGDTAKAIEKLESIVNYTGKVSIESELVRNHAEKKLSILKPNN